ncbi:hypothetical protein [Microlunatus antarcticus]|uniref:Uncharacterized protein n=1 Tax=Microlunatus antarcticus TaxID=53388 RepID=A0A7W5JS11_9ACTN|nr:hypothetical protein [Microlunatus antarcticus]MBB3325180.1 hypothetical protein [Microlunatus antarcticus]
MSDENAEETDAELTLPAGITAAQVNQAILRSGYPLQTVVTHKVSAIDGLVSKSEWGFRDRFSGEMRAIDLQCFVDLSDGDPNRYRVRPGVAALIECKRSELPYVFFSEATVPFGNFPVVAGLRSDDLEFKTDDDRSTWALPILQSFDLTWHDFVRSAASCTTLSKCERSKGKDLVLSGSDAYQSLVMPLRSAVEHYCSSIKPTNQPYYFDAHLVLGIAVLDAPMLAATIGSDGQLALSNVQWQRLWRNEPVSGTEFAREHGETSAIDIVHVDFLDEYLQSHLLPFGRAFAELAQTHAEELASGRAFARGMGENSFTGIAERMEPRSAPLPPPPVRVTHSAPRASINLAVDLVKLVRSNLRTRCARRKL